MAGSGSFKYNLEGKKPLEKWLLANLLGLGCPMGFPSLSSGWVDFGTHVLLLTAHGAAAGCWIPRRGCCCKRWEAELETVIEPWVVPTGESFAVFAPLWETSLKQAIPRRRNAEDF